MLGTYALSAGYYDAYYGKASQVRTLLARDFAAAFEQVDAIVSPVAPTPAFDIGQNVDDPMQMYLSDVLTLSCNLAGLPGISLPCGPVRHGPAHRPADHGPRTSPRRPSSPWATPSSRPRSITRPGHRCKLRLRPKKTNRPGRV